MKKFTLSTMLSASVASATTLFPVASSACGGFFCTTVPINQAAEQIVFRQRPGRVTAMVRIAYSGNAEDFSWVVPVPDTPEISIGTDTTFNELDFSTQPLFQLQQEGNVCEQDELVFPDADTAAVAESASDGEGGVVIEEELTVGPFDIDIVSSDNPDDMSIWLQENGYLLTDRGTELIEPYVLDGMKFVALKLRSGESSGNIQPIILDYPSDRPMVPIRLTAVAAEDDMGVLVWVVNDQLGRAIPDNYLHVVPNYARVDWFSGPFNAYGSYQSLITDAMNESGGQGFATDFAGTLDASIAGSLTGPQRVESNLVLLDNIDRDAQFITESLLISTNPSVALSNLQTILPVPAGLDTNLYFQPEQLEATFTPTELRDARVAMREVVVTRELNPLQDSVSLLPEGAYLTRLFTTLSADEMTLDPTFDYNTTMPDQTRERNALLSASCDNDVSNWQLILGEGTGRDGEIVADVSGEPLPIFNGVPEPLDDQPAAFLRQRTSADAEPETLFQAELSTVFVGSTDTTSSSSSSSGGSSGIGSLGGGVLALISGIWMLRRYRSGNCSRRIRR